jgi:transglutaminase-like putative cysteine protease
MPQLYRILTAVLACTGTISLVITGEVNPILSLTGLGLIPGYYRYLRDMPPAPKWAIGGLSLITVGVFFFDSLILSDDYLVGVAHLTITFQAIKSFDLKEPWDHLQVYFMSLLQLIIVSELIFSVVFGVIFILFLIAFVAAMVIAHFMKEGVSHEIGIKGPVISISIITFMVTVFIFVSSPRIAGGLWGKGYMKSIKTAGFSESVDFGSFGTVKHDPTIVMRIEMDEKARGPFYWRGMTLNYFDGISWKDTLRERKWIHKDEGKFVIRPFEEDKTVVQRIYLEAMDTNVLFGLREVAAIETKGRFLFRDDAGALFLHAKKGKRLNYLVYSDNQLPALNRLEESTYLQLPRTIKKIAILARKITQEKKGDMEKAQAIERYLMRNHTYSLSTLPPPEGVGPIEDFLFYSRKGYCEHYATSMVLMLRALDIPSRIVTGFVGGEPNEYGGYMIVRQSDAHSWVEAAIDGVWRRYDPTPAVILQRQTTFSLYMDLLVLMWDRYVVGFSRSDQRDLFRNFQTLFQWQTLKTHKTHIPSLPVSILFLTMFVLLVILIIKKVHVRRIGFVSEQYKKIRSNLNKRGAKILPSSTPSDIQREAQRIGKDGNISEFLAIYQKIRFGGERLDRGGKLRIKQLVKGIRRNK